MALLEIKDLTFSYPNASKNALENVNLNLERGNFCFVCGKSGSGKSTLLRLFKKELAPFGKTSGKIEINTDKIGYLNQNVESNIVTDTVFGELQFALQNTELTNSQAALKIAETASYFNLNSYIDEKTENLSGGVKQLLALACTMVLMPDLLVLDEPCSQLDPVSAQSFYSAVRRLNRENGVTVIMCEHKSDLMADADCTLFLDSGRAEFFGSPNGLANHLVANSSDMAAILPAYTQLLKSTPLDFTAAKIEVEKLCEKPYIKPDIKGETASLVAKGICFAYKKGGRDILFDLDYKAYKGKINAVVGANGSGKTTLLKCLAKVSKPYGGKIKTSGKTALMPQNVQTVFLYDTVAEEVQDSQIIEQFSLSKLLGRNPFDLSGGEAQRVAIAKAIQSGADIILLDEPTKSVDAAFKTELARILKRLCDEGKTIILVTHDLEFAGRYADYVSFLFSGKIASSDDRRAFFSSLEIYTTSLSRMSGGRIVSVDDAKEEK